MLKKVTVGLILLLFATAATFIVLMFTDAEDHAVQEPNPFGELRDHEMVMHYPPHYGQDSPRWADLPYADGTVSDSGCGLMVYASTLSYMTKDTETYTPDKLLDNPGNFDIVNAGVNDMSMTKYFLENRGVELSDIYWESDHALISIEAGKLVWASVTGYLLDEYYGGHIVMLYGMENAIGIYDPKRPDIRSLSREDFDRTPWVYFYDVTLP
jgi:hypothetical protein